MNYYYLVDDINTLSLNDLDLFVKSSFTHNAVYAVMAILIDDGKIPSERFISVGGQMIMTNRVNIKILMNRIELNIQRLIPTYGVNAFLRGKFAFKWRVISYNTDISESIGDAIPHRSIEDPNCLEDINFTFHDVIPMCYDITKYARYVDKDLIINNYRIMGKHYKYNDEITIFIHTSNKANSRRLTLFKNDEFYGECVDTLSSNMLIRKYEHGLVLYIDNDKESLIQFNRDVECLKVDKPLLGSSTKKNSKRDLKISAFDIEAYSDKEQNGIFIAYAVGYINPSGETHTYYLSDFNSTKDMLKKCLKDMIESNPKLGTVYVHNLSKFDTFFIDPILLNDKEIIGKYVYNKSGKVLSINVSFKDKSKKGSFKFRDSLLITQSSLKKLAASFNTKSHRKLDFPHKFVTKDRITLNYEGDKPDITYYEDISKENYDRIPTY